MLGTEKLTFSLLCPGEPESDEVMVGLKLGTETPSESSRFVPVTVNVPELFTIAYCWLMDVIWGMPVKVTDIGDDSKAIQPPSDVGYPDPSANGAICVSVIWFWLLTASGSGSGSPGSPHSSPQGGCSGGGGASPLGIGIK